MAVKLAHPTVTPRIRHAVRQQEQREAIAKAAATFLLNAGMTAPDMALLAAARPCPTFAMTAQTMAAR